MQKWLLSCLTIKRCGTSLSTLAHKDSCFFDECRLRLSSRFLVNLRVSRIISKKAYSEFLDPHIQAVGHHATYRATRKRTLHNKANETLSDINGAGTLSMRAFVRPEVFGAGEKYCKDLART